MSTYLLIFKGQLRIKKQSRKEPERNLIYIRKQSGHRALSPMLNVSHNP